MKISGVIGVCIFVVVVMGCASAAPVPPGAALVKQPAQRFDDAGFSVVPPPGDGWYGMRIGGMVTFGKVFSRTHSFIASIAVVRIRNKFKTPEDFLHFVEQAKANGTSSSRFTVLKSDFTLDTAEGPDCVKYHRRAEDHDSPDAPGKTLILDVFGVSCLHPDDPGRAVDLEYSERSESGDLTSSVYSEGQAFLSSLQFVPLKKSGG